MQEHIDEFVSAGYSKLETDSGTGATILRSPDEKDVLKFNQDIAYDLFVVYVQTNSNDALPKIYSHECYNGALGLSSHMAYTLTSMEVLLKLDPNERQSIHAWVQDFLSALHVDSNAGTRFCDPYGLRNCLARLVPEAKKRDLGIDLIDKQTNIMKRKKGAQIQYVLSDPWAPLPSEPGKASEYISQFV